MKKSLWDYKKIYIVMFITIACTVAGVSFLYRDISGNAADIAEKNLTGNTEIFVSYFDDCIEGYFKHLEQLAKLIDEPVYKKSEEVTDLLQDYRGIFSSVSVMTVDGAQEYGDYININFDEDNMLRTLVYNKEPVVYNKTIHVQDEPSVILLAVPIEMNDKVIGIVVGTVSVETLNTLMDNWGSNKEGCAFLISQKGSYMTRGKQFDGILGGIANSFFTYLTRGALEGEYDAVSDIESEVTARSKLSFRHQYGGKKYLTVLCPSRYGNWYLGFVEGVNVSERDGFAMQDSTQFYVMVAAVLWIILLVVFGVLNYREHHNNEVLERYFILDQMEKCIIFEFLFEPKRFKLFGDTMEMFGAENRVLRGEEVYDVYRYIHEDDRSLRGRIHQFYDGDTKKFMSEVRIKNTADGQYGWFRISGMLVKDPQFGTNQKFIGKIESADQKIAQEKNLVHRAENDLLTGVLNKTTMEEKVKNCLRGINGNIHYIFFMVDLDNFKNVNDKLGHIYGDNAIVDTAKKLTDIFANNDKAYVGRLGGDEFAVCAAYDAFDEESLMEYIKKKAEKICQANRRAYTNGNETVNITSSVGIAIAPDFGEDFETIYKMADNALYRSKNGGKNCYHIYQKG